MKGDNLSAVRLPRRSLPKNPFVGFGNDHQDGGPRPHRMTRSDSYLRIRYIEPGNGNINGDFEITVMELNREQFEQAKEKFSDQEVKGIPIYWCHIEGKIEFWPPYLVQGPANMSR